MFLQPQPIVAAADWRESISPGDIVLFSFPVSETDPADITPKSRPCLVLETPSIAGTRFAMLAYGTSVRSRANRGYEIIVKQPASLLLAGLEKPTHFIGARRLIVGLDHAGFDLSKQHDNRKRGTGILNNQLYVGRYVWDRLSYSKHPKTGKRISKLKPEDTWTRTERAHLRLMGDALWESVKARQELIDDTRQTAMAEGKSGAGASQASRRRKYLLSGLLTCGNCGGNLTVAGKGARRRYYCANAKEKGAAVCEGMPGVKETDAAECILGGLRNGLMQDGAYADFRERYLSKLRDQEETSGEALRRHDVKIRDAETAHRNLLKAVESGTFSEALITRLNSVDADLKVLRAERDALVPDPIELPADLPALYRRYVDDLVGTLTSEEVAGPAADELHRLVKTVIVSWDEGQKLHSLELRGELIEILAKIKPADTASLVSNGCSLKLVAGVGFEPTTFRL